MRFLLRALVTLLVVALPIFVVAQGVTTAAMSGRLTDGSSGEPLIGATIQAVHTPSGSTYGNVTDADGFFRLAGMRVGGPYTVTATYVGYEPITQEGIFLRLGQDYTFNEQLGTSGVDLTEITVVSSRSDVFDGKRTGQETSINEEQINVLPTVSRSIADFARLNPFAQINEGGDGFAIQIAGQNNRFNSIYIDGAVNNDVFGLAGSGVNGGQTGVSPISLDAVEQFVVSVAPFDIRQSGFAGGSISAVTRSGTNEFEGSAYYLFRNDGLTRDNGFTNDEGFNFANLSDFSARTYGARLGGPIIKDKVFFFVNAELQRDETPQVFDLGNYEGDSDASDLEDLRNFVSDNYGYNVGSFDDNTAFLDSDKIIGKLDFNLSSNQKLSLRHSYVRAENLEARASGSNDIDFINGSEFFVSTTNSTALELNSLFANNTANNLTIGATFVRDDRDQFGPQFPEVTIDDGEGRIRFGGEPFSSANLLNQDVITIRNDFSLYRGQHNILIGANVEFFSAGNLFIRQNFGDYQFNGVGDTSGLEQFFLELPATRFDRSFSQVDNVVGDESGAIAEFNQTLLGFYIQDEFTVNDRLRLTGGLRIDVPIWPDDVPVNESFNTETVDQVTAVGNDLQGARTGDFIGTQIAFSPRLSFNYDVYGDRSLQIRGGVGRFTSRIPLVWPGGAYNNYGFNVGGVRLEDEEAVVFDPDINNQPGEVNLADPSPSGQIDLFAEDFRLPQTTKVNLAVDYQLPWGVIMTVEGLYTKFHNYLRYTRLDLDPGEQRNLTGTPDNRVIYTDDRFLDTPYNGIYLASNTDKGYSWNGSLVFQKPFESGFLGTVGYSYGDSYSLFDGTSSQNNSQWRGFTNPAGRNEDRDAQRSNFAAGHRVFGNIAYTILGENTNQTFSLFMNGQTSRSYSYVIDANNNELVNDGGFNNEELVFVPASRGDIILEETTVGGVTFSPDEQYEILDQFISDDNHLSDRRGDFSERNGAWGPFNTIFDARFLQEFKINTGKNTNVLQFSLDVFNLNNLLNKDWGQINRVGGSYRLLNLEDLSDEGVPTYSVVNEVLRGASPDEIYDNNLVDSGLRSSRWTMQLGVRYIFQ